MLSFEYNSECYIQTAMLLGFNRIIGNKSKVRNRFYKKHLLSFSEWIQAINYQILIQTSQKKERIVLLILKK